MKKQLSMLAILVGASLNAQAAQSPFFTIVDDEVKGYASGISADASGLIGINTTNNMAEYFSTVRSADFLVDRFRFEYGCFLSEDVCNTFWDEGPTPTYAYQWRRDFLDGLDQRSNVGHVISTETDGLVTALGDVPADRVGYKMNGKLRTAFAIVNDGTPVELKDAAGTHSLSIPTAIKKLESGQYLVTGTAASGKYRHNVGGDFYNWCFAGDDEDYGDLRYCPGVDTQASFWLLDGSGGFNKLMQAGDYGHPRDEVLQTASALGVAEYKGTLYGVGYSSTGEVGSGELDGRNLASYWKLDPKAGTVGVTQIIPLIDGEPGQEIDDSERLQHSWAVGISDSGYVVGNQRWNVNKGQNRPVEMFVFNLNSPTTKASVPLQDNPLKGSGSEAAAINDHNMVVGWRDSRHQTQPVTDGTNRMQEAFLLDAVTGNNWYLNDLICELDAAGAKLCAQNGYFYHIAYASGISTDGTVVATAYRYNSESDLNLRTNATVVSVKLTPVVKDYQGNAPASYVVSNAPANNQSGQDGEDGGGGSLFWLTLLALPFAWLRRHPR
jgi:hypothetical protein